jgi:hypothetical protein
MKKVLFLCIFAGSVVRIAAGGAAAGPEQGLLVSETGDLIPGYTSVIIDNGLAYPVRSLTDGRWYEVTIIHRAADGTILCTIGEALGEMPEGVAVDEGETDEDVTDDETTESRPE